MARVPAGAAWLVALLVLAGCADDPAGPRSPTPTGGGTPTQSASGTPTPAPAPPVLDLLLGFAFSSCQGLTASVTRPLADVQGLLPDGFAARPAAGAPDTGTFLVEVLACGNLTTPAVAVQDVAVGMVAASIERPAQRVPGAPEAAHHEYVFRMLAGDDLLSKLWPAAGYDMHNGTAEVMSFQETGPTRLGLAGIGPEYTILGTGATAVPPAAREGAFARYTLHNAGDGSVLLWTGAYALTPVATGPGYVEVPDGDPLARFAPPERSALPAVVGHVEEGGMSGQDLRRIFTPA